jgi:hypothetical protein
VYLPPITITADQVEALTWRWEQYKKSIGTNTPLTKMQWFVFNSTNQILIRIQAETDSYRAERETRMRHAWATNATKRARIEAIVDE